MIDGPAEGEGERGIGGDGCVGMGSLRRCSDFDRLKLGRFPRCADLSKHRLNPGLRSLRCAWVYDDVSGGILALRGCGAI